MCSTANKNISIISNKTMTVLLQKITPHKKQYEEHDEFCHFVQCNCEHAPNPVNKIPLTFIEVGHHRGIQHLKTTKET